MPHPPFPYIQKLERVGPWIYADESHCPDHGQGFVAWGQEDPATIRQKAMEYLHENYPTLVPADPSFIPIYTPEQLDNYQEPAPLFPCIERYQSVNTIYCLIHNINQQGNDPVDNNFKYLGNDEAVAIEKAAELGFPNIRIYDSEEIRLLAGAPVAPQPIPSTQGPPMLTNPIPCILVYGGPRHMLARTPAEITSRAHDIPLGCTDSERQVWCKAFMGITTTGPDLPVFTQEQAEAAWRAYEAQQANPAARQITYPLLYKYTLSSTYWLCRNSDEARADGTHGAVDMGTIHFCQGNAKTLLGMSMTAPDLPVWNQDEFTAALRQTPYKPVFPFPFLADYGENGFFLVIGFGAVRPDGRLQAGALGVRHYHTLYTTDVDTAQLASKEILASDHPGHDLPVFGKQQIKDCMNGIPLPPIAPPGPLELRQMLPATLYEMVTQYPGNPQVKGMCLAHFHKSGSDFYIPEEVPAIEIADYIRTNYKPGKAVPPAAQAPATPPQVAPVVNIAPARVAPVTHRIEVTYTEIEYGRCRYSRTNSMSANLRVTDEQLREWLEESNGDLDGAYEAMREYLEEQARDNANTDETHDEDTEDHESTDSETNNFEFGQGYGLLETFLETHPELNPEHETPAPPVDLQPEVEDEEEIEDDGGDEYDNEPEEEEEAETPAPF